MRGDGQREDREGISDLDSATAAAVPEELWADYVELNYRLGREPSLLGAAQHLLYVGRQGPQPQAASW